MPVTPFHFGPGALVHALAPRHVSFLAFCAVNVLIDIESLYNLVTWRYPVHAFLHTYVGASLVAAAAVAALAGIRRLAAGLSLPDWLHSQGPTLRQVALGAAAGSYSHVALDSVMHADIRPLAPFSGANPLLGAVSLGVLHWSCLVAGAAAVLVLGARRRMTPPTPRQSAGLSAVLILLLCACASPRPVSTVVPQISLDLRDHLPLEPARLLARFAECVSPVGPTRELPVAEDVAEQEAWRLLRVLETMSARHHVGVSIPLQQAPLVMDGYQHWLQVSSSSPVVYILQVGGLLGTRTVFGPFPAEQGCAAV
jgi:hypothetical protein